MVLIIQYAWKIPLAHKSVVVYQDIGLGTYLDFSIAITHSYALEKVYYILV